MKTFNTTMKLLLKDFFANLTVEEKDELQMFMEKFK